MNEEDFPDYAQEDPCRYCINTDNCDICDDDYSEWEEL